MLACLPDLGNAGRDVRVGDPLKAHRPKGAPEGVFIGLSGVAVIAAGQLPRNIAEGGGQVHLGRLGIRVDLEPHELPNRRDIRLRRVYLGVHGRECPEGVMVVHEGIDEDDAVFFEVVAHMAPVMVLQGVKPPRLLGLGIAAWKHTEPVWLGIVNWKHRKTLGRISRLDEMSYQISILAEVSPGLLLHVLEVHFMRRHDKYDITGPIFST